MKRVLALGLMVSLILSSCLPRASPPPDTDRATLSTVVRSGVTVLRFDPIADEVVNLTLELRGDGLVVSTEGCKASGVFVRCAVPIIPTGKAFAVPFSGALEAAEAVFFRPDGSRHGKEWPP